MKKTEVQDRLCRLALAAQKGGSKIMEFLPHRATDAEIEKWEAEIGMPFTPLVREIVYLCGHGLAPASSKVEPPFLEIGPSLGVLSFKDAMSVFRSEKKPRWLIPHPSKLVLSEEDYAILPMLTDFQDFVSLVWTAGNSCSLIVRRNGFRVPSEHWSSPLDFVDFQTRCWEMGIYRISDSDLEIDWYGMDKLMRGYQVKVVIE